MSTYESKDLEIADLRGYLEGCSSLIPGEGLLVHKIQRLLERTISCCFCGQQCASLEELKEHSGGCPEHPLSRRVEELEVLLKELRKFWISNPAPLRQIRVVLKETR